jgi:GNAT superfamily N-acetyltransferase
MKNFETLTITPENFSDIWFSRFQNFELFGDDLINPSLKKINFFNNNFSRMLDYRLYCVMDGLNVAGVAYVGYYDSFNDPRWAISYISVNPNYQRRGISKTLIQQITNFAKEIYDEFGQIKTSGFTEMGDKYLRHQFNPKYFKLREGVEF